ncbi:MAG: ribosomal protein S18-alanine N-acetyltransferase [Alphaproteobacteria bacterium]|nr:ribosomal protein S18-alanine N-acetyltransferase [Alphaproteobacteria bacterium]
MQGSNDAVLRVVGIADAAQLSALHARSMDDAWTAEAFAGLLATGGIFGLLAVAGGDPAGFVLARTVADEAEIIGLAVIPSRRGRGVGGDLLEAAMRTAKANGARRVLLEVSEINAAAIALYRARGFATVGRRKQYYVRAGGAEDALIMAAELAEAEPGRNWPDGCGSDGQGL